MHCPYCRTPLTENSPECPGCRLNLARASSLLGPVPGLESRLSDHASLLSTPERSRLLKRIDRFNRRFPQVRLQVLCRTFPTEQPFDLYQFWIFNLGRISNDLEKGGENRVILLTLDPDTRRSGIMVGYGLEPFMTESELDTVLSLADPEWRNGQWEAGLLYCIDGLDRLLEDSIFRISRVFAHSPRPGKAQSRAY